MGAIKFLKERPKLTVALIFLFLGLALYGNSFANQFFWDDDDSIVNNAYIKDWSNFPKFWTENLIAGSGQVTNYYRPVLLTSFSLDYQFFKLSPAGYHFTNTFLHILNAWLLFFLLIKIIDYYRGRDNKNYVLAFLPALFFLIHPLQTEAVTYVAGRADPLSVLFGLLSVILYFDYRRERNLWKIGFSLGLFVLAILSKEQAFLFAGLLGLIELCFLIKKKKDWLAAIYALLLFALIMIIYLGLRFTLLNFNDLLRGFNYAPGYNQSLYVRLLTFTRVFVEFVKLLFAPLGLHMAREVAPITSIFRWPVAWFFALLTLGIYGGVKTWEKNRLVAFGLAWFLLILLPRTNILAINRPMYEHWLYFAMPGFWLSLAALGDMASSKADRLSQKSKPIVLGSIIIAFGIFLSVLTVLRNIDWHDPITFYEKNLRYTPLSFIQHNNLGMAYANAGRLDEATREYRRAIEISDSYPQVHSNLANTLKSRGQTSEAIIEYERALVLSPAFSIPYSNLLAIYIEEKNKTKAYEVLKRAQSELGVNENTLYLAGVTYYNFKDYGRAIESFRNILKINPSDAGIQILIEEVKIKKEAERK